MSMRLFISGSWTRTLFCVLCAGITQRCATQSNTSAVHSQMVHSTSMTAFSFTHWAICACATHWSSERLEGLFHDQSSSIHVSGHNQSKVLTDKNRFLPVMKPTCRKINYTDGRSQFWSFALRAWGDPFLHYHPDNINPLYWDNAEGSCSLSKQDFSELHCQESGGFQFKDNSSKNPKLSDHLIWMMYGYSSAANHTSACCRIC